MSDTSKRVTDDDVAFDEQGDPVLVGPEVDDNINRILRDPAHTPIMIVAMLHESIAVRVFGPPSEKTADLLTEVAVNYRKALMLSRAGQQ